MTPITHTSHHLNPTHRRGWAQIGVMFIFRGWVMPGLFICSAYLGPKFRARVVWRSYLSVCKGEIAKNEDEESKE